MPASVRPREDGVQSWRNFGMLSNVSKNLRPPMTTSRTDAVEAALPCLSSTRGAVELDGAGAREQPRWTAATAAAHQPDALAKELRDFNQAYGPFVSEHPYPTDVPDYRLVPPASVTSGCMVSTWEPRDELDCCASFTDNDEVLCTAYERVVWTVAEVHPDSGRVTLVCGGGAGPNGEVRPNKDFEAADWKEAWITGEVSSWAPQVGEVVLYYSISYADKKAMPSFAQVTDHAQPVSHPFSKVTDMVRIWHPRLGREVEIPAWQLAPCWLPRNTRLLARCGLPGVTTGDITMLVEVKCSFDGQARLRDIRDGYGGVLNGLQGFQMQPSVLQRSSCAGYAPAVAGETSASTADTGSVHGILSAVAVALLSATRTSDAGTGLQSRSHAAVEGDSTLGIVVPARLEYDVGSSARGSATLTACQHGSTSPSSARAGVCNSGAPGQVQRTGVLVGCSLRLNIAMVTAGPNGFAPDAAVLPEDQESSAQWSAGVAGAACEISSMSRSPWQDMDGSVLQQPSESLINSSAGSARRPTPPAEGHESILLSTCSEQHTGSTDPPGGRGQRTMQNISKPRVHCSSAHSSMQFLDTVGGHGSNTLSMAPQIASQHGYCPWSSASEASCGGNLSDFTSTDRSDDGSAGVSTQLSAGHHSSGQDTQSAPSMSPVGGGNRCEQCSMLRTDEFGSGNEGCVLGGGGGASLNDEAQGHEAAAPTAARPMAGNNITDNVIQSACSGSGNGGTTHSSAPLCRGEVGVQPCSAKGAGAASINGVAERCDCHTQTPSSEPPMESAGSNAQGLAKSTGANGDETCSSGPRSTQGFAQSAVDGGEGGVGTHSSVPLSVLLDGGTHDSGIISTAHGFALTSGVTGAGQCSSFHSAQSLVSQAGTASNGTAKAITLSLVGGHAGNLQGSHAAQAITGHDGTLQPMGMGSGPTKGVEQSRMGECSTLLLEAASNVMQDLHTGALLEQQAISSHPPSRPGCCVGTLSSSLSSVGGGDIGNDDTAASAGTGNGDLLLQQRARTTLQYQRPHLSNEATGTTYAIGQHTGHLLRQQQRLVAAGHSGGDTAAWVSDSGGTARAALDISQTAQLGLRTGKLLPHKAHKALQRQRPPLPNQQQASAMQQLRSAPVQRLSPAQHQHQRQLLLAAPQQQQCSVLTGGICFHQALCPKVQWAGSPTRTHMVAGPRTEEAALVPANGIDDASVPFDPGICSKRQSLENEGLNGEVQLPSLPLTVRRCTECTPVTLLSSTSSNTGTGVASCHSSEGSASFGEVGSNCGVLAPLTAVPNSHDPIAAGSNMVIATASPALVYSSEGGGAAVSISTSNGHHSIAGSPSAVECTMEAVQLVAVATAGACRLAEAVRRKAMVLVQQGTARAGITTSAQCATLVPAQHSPMAGRTAMTTRSIDPGEVAARNNGSYTGHTSGEGEAHTAGSCDAICNGGGKAYSYAVLRDDEVGTHDVVVLRGREKDVQPMAHTAGLRRKAHGDVVARGFEDKEPNATGEVGGSSGVQTVPRRAMMRTPGYASRARARAAVATEEVVVSSNWAHVRRWRLTADLVGRSHRSGAAYSRQDLAECPRRSNLKGGVMLLSSLRSHGRNQAPSPPPAPERTRACRADTHEKRYLVTLFGGMGGWTLGGAMAGLVPLMWFDNNPIHCPPGTSAPVSDVRTCTTGSGCRGRGYDPFRCWKRISKHCKQNGILSQLVYVMSPPCNDFSGHNVHRDRSAGMKLVDWAVEFIKLVRQTCC
ncbi:hypothetical protein JKP88DRAFT_249263 [Tribonema minus]|uniref:Uncharacterized protein n=1 Tax=Tribonema minus TaxID=303371 RepID=A0A835YJZ2_9STRA|nr:hypothetical protein JKP88DRAFT_249263 [Tribonema minus]